MIFPDGTDAVTSQVFDALARCLTTGKVVPLLPQSRSKRVIGCLVKPLPIDIGIPSDTKVSAQSNLLLIPPLPLGECVATSQRSRNRWTSSILDSRVAP